MALIDPASTGLLVAGGLMLALAGALLWIDFANRVNRAFALFLALRAMVNAVQAFLEGDVGVAAYYSLGYFMIATPIATLWFLHLYRVRYAGVPAVPWVGPALLVVAAVLLGAYVFEHAWFLGPPPFVGSTPGPLGFVLSSIILAYGVAAWVFARDHARAIDGARRPSLYLLSFGMALDALFYAVVFPLAYAVPGAPRGPTALLTATVAASALIPLALAVRWIFHGSVSRRDRRLYLGGLAVVLVSVVASIVMLLVSSDLGAIALVVSDAVWTALMPLLAAYALVRHQLFDIDVKLRWTISRGTVAAVFAVVFVVVAQVAQEYLHTTYGLLLGGVATAMLLFVITPVQRFAERVASAAVPGVRPVAELDRDARLALYREQLAAAWSDGALSADEVRMLRVARDRLGLSLEDVDRLEREAAGQ
ncbi:MAG TPA: hypothetical protein VI997_08130 [Candidatus Thermoplasmatota archaeon]|nr:hypothetical protein [Candidatus Thermoplasmatota archaeon]